MNLREKFTGWIFDSFSVTPEGLGLYRIFTALLILSFMLPSTEMYYFLPSLPNDFFNPPPGPMWFFEGFPSEIIFFLLHAILILALICVLVGFKTTLTSISAGIVLLIIKGFFYSLGKINHDLLLAVVPIVMAFSGWGAAYSVDSWMKSDKEDTQEVHSWPFTLLALFIGFMMFTAGFAKLLGGWLNPDTHATLGHLFNQYFVKGRQDLLAEWALGFDYRFIWELLDYATVLFEVGFLFAILNPRSTRLFVSFAIVFHFSIMMILNISFLPNFPAYAAFLNWTLIDQELQKRFSGKFAAPGRLLVIFLTFTLVGLVGSQLGFPNLESDLQSYEFYIVSLALPVALGYIIREIMVTCSQSYELPKTESSLSAGNRD